MGLFSSVLRVVSPIGNTILGAKANKKAIGRANDATQLGITNATGALNDQLAATQGRLDPYETLGTNAAGQQGDILGLNGAGAQGSIIDQLKASPLFQSLFRTGHDTLLNDASATGGLRGGNFARSEMDFGSDTLAKVIQNQLQNLSPLSSQGLAATQFGGQLGAANAGAVAGLDVGSGQANAGAILGKQQVSNNMFDQLQKLFTSAVTGGAGGGLGALFGGIGGGSGNAGIAATPDFQSSFTLSNGQTWTKSMLQKLFDAGLAGDGRMNQLNPSQITGPSVNLPPINLPF